MKVRFIRGYEHPKEKYAQGEVKEFPPAKAQWFVEHKIAEFVKVPVKVPLKIHKAVKKPKSERAVAPRQKDESGKAPASTDNRE